MKKLQNLQNGEKFNERNMLRVMLNSGEDSKAGLEVPQIKVFTISGNIQHKIPVQFSKN